MKDLNPYGVSSESNRSSEIILYINRGVHLLPKSQVLPEDIEKDCICFLSLTLSF